MTRSFIISIAFASALLFGCGNPEVSVVDNLPADDNTTLRMTKLPAGSIKPEGWLKEMLIRQKNGLCGHLLEISAWLQKDDNAWLKAGGAWGWEEVPYWLRGYAAMSYILEDEAMLDESRFWIDAILSSQRADGNFGPVVLRGEAGSQDLWPNMLALWILQDYYEYSGDERVIPFMTKYFEYQMTIPDDKFLEDFWENSRAGDNLWSVLWLYNRTKDSRLLSLAEKLHANTADWTDPTSLPNWHNVNVAQCFREPAIYSLFGHGMSFVNASYGAFHLMRRAFGQAPGGMFGGDENCRIGYFDPRQGAETCGFAEQMASDEIMLQITGDPFWAENCEDVAFNSYPAAFMPDMKSLRYITSPNQAISTAVNHHPGIDNRGPFMAMNPLSSRCCQHNHGFAWPYYNDHLVMASSDAGVGIALYNSCTARVKVADGQEIRIVETTNYPFDETIRFEICCAEDVEFPLYLRLPSWCEKPSISVCGRGAGALAKGRYARIERVWHNGDIVELSLPMKISTRTWQVNNNSVSVDYGPLTLSLKIGEEYRLIETSKTVAGDSKWQNGTNPEDWPAYEILPSTPWNYALDVASGVTVEKKSWPSSNFPFTQEECPLEFKAKGRTVPSWTVDQYELTGTIPYENAPKSSVKDDITLIPMGAARLRISSFPTCD